MAKAQQTAARTIMQLLVCTLFSLPCIDYPSHTLEAMPLPECKHFWSVGQSVDGGEGRSGRELAIVRLQTWITPIRIFENPS